MDGHNSDYESLMSQVHPLDAPMCWPKYRSSCCRAPLCMGVYGGAHCMLCLKHLSHIDAWIKLEDGEVDEYTDMMGIMAK